MSNKTFFVFDTHFGHNNIITFDDAEGKRIRPFETIEEHDDTIINNINAVVGPNDRLYFGGDVAINRRCLPSIARCNGKKKLIKGNHDIFQLKDYVPYFEDIIAYRIYPKHNLIVSHIPVHTSQLENRFKWNLHGHVHANSLDDSRYINGCLEKTNFKPISLDELIETLY